MAEHEYAIKTNNEDYLVAYHFQQQRQPFESELLSFWSSLSDVAIISINYFRESYWIFKCDALVYAGLNEESDC